MTDTPKFDDVIQWSSCCFLFIFFTVTRLY